MRFFLSLLLIVMVCGNVSSQEKKEEKITYEDHVKPIFRAHCFSCHNQNKKEGDLDLTNYTSLMQGGGSGAVIEPGAVSDSYLFALVNHDEEPSMPPEQPKIPDDKIALLSKWIELGALENTASKAMIKKKKSFDFALTDPAVGKPSVIPLPAKLDRQPVIHAERPTGTTAMATSPWAPLTAIAGQKQVLLYDSNTRELKGVLPFPEGVISVLKFSRNGSLLLAGGGRGGASGLVVVWNIKNGERIIQVGDELDTVLAADLSSDQKMVALGGPQKLVRVYSTEDNSLLYEIKKHTDWVTALEFSPDGVLLTTGDRNGGVHVWEAFSGRPYLTLDGHNQSVNGISWRSDSNIVATTSEDGEIRLWEMNNGSRVRNWGAHGGGSLGVEFTRDGRLVSCGRDRTAKIWDQAGKQLFAFPAFQDIVMSVTHCDESNTCFAGDWTGEIRQFNAADGQQLGTISSNPPPLEEQLTVAQQASEQATQQAKTLAEAAARDKQQVDELAARIESYKKQMTESDARVKQLTAEITRDRQAMDAAGKSLQEIKTQVTAWEGAIPPLTQAKTNAEQALAKLPEDPDLKKLAESFATVLTAKQAELDKKKVEMNGVDQKMKELTATLAKAEEMLKAAQAALTESQKNLAAAEPMLKPAQDKYAQSQAAAAQAQAGAESAQAKVASIQAAIEFSQAYRQLVTNVKSQNQQLEELAIRHAESVAAAEEAQKAMTEKISAVEEARKKVEEQNGQVTMLASRMETVAANMNTMKNEMAVAEKMMQQTQAVTQHLTTAQQSIVQAQKAAPEDPKVKAALDSMVSLLAEQNQKASEYQTMIKERMAQVATMTEELSKLGEQKAAADQQLQMLQVTMTESSKALEMAQAKATELAAAAKQAEEKVQQKEQEISTLKDKIAELQGI